MRRGALTMRVPGNLIFGQRVLWQPTLPRWRLRPPPGSKVVLERPLWGQEARLAHRCETCATLVIPPDEVYDGGEGPSSGVVSTRRGRVAEQTGVRGSDRLDWVFIALAGCVGVVSVALQLWLSALGMVLVVAGAVRRLHRRGTRGSLPESG